MRWFNVIYIGEPEIQACLDAIILCANPQEKDSAHITIQGPFSSYSNSRDAPAEIAGSKISVLGAGKFFEGPQNTVFLSCGSQYIKKHWSKSDYPFRPHITLYDGGSRIFAEKLLSLLKGHNFYFEITAGKIATIRSIPGQKSFGLWFGIDPRQIKEMTGECVDVYSMFNIPDWRRLMLIERVCAHLKGLALRSSMPTLKRRGLTSDIV